MDTIRDHIRYLKDHIIQLEAWADGHDTAPAPDAPYEMLGELKYDNCSGSVLADINDKDGNIIAESADSNDNCKLFLKRLHHEHSCGIPILAVLPKLIYLLEKFGSQGALDMVESLDAILARLNAGPEAAAKQ